MRTILVAILGFFLGGVGSFFYKTQVITLPTQPLPQVTKSSPVNRSIHNHVVGFLPYWLLDKADKDYSSSLTTLTYFGLVIDDDGHIQKFSAPLESEPGWYTLNSGKADKHLAKAKEKNLELSLAIFASEHEVIEKLMENPLLHSNNFMDDVSSIMKKYGFKDLNLDIESVSDASISSQRNFATFVSEVKKRLVKDNLGTLTITIGPSDFVLKRLISPELIHTYADYIVIMGYDYHYIGSSVTGAVAPLNGAGITAEFDVASAIEKALKMIPKEKIILGVPVYGYEWETISPENHAAVIRGTGSIASNSRAEELLSECSKCVENIDTEAKEKYITFKNDSGTFTQLFYPDASAMQAKIDFATEKELGGLALWAIGYEGDKILKPLENYKISN